MTDATVMEIAHRSLMLAITVSAPVLGFGLAIGLVISVFQAATQIHEMSLTFIPKLIGIGLALVIFGQWMLKQVIDFTSGLFQSIPTLIK